VPLYAFGLGATPFEIGVIGGAAGVVYTFGPYVMGRLSDRIGRLRLIAASLLFSSALSSAYVFSSIPMHLLLIRLLEGVPMAMLWPSLAAAVVATSSSPSRGVRNYNLAWSAGALSGPLIGGALMSFVAVKAPFLAGLGLTLFFGVFGVILLCSSSTETRTERFDEAPSDLRFKLRGIAVPLLGVFLYAFVIFTLSTLFPPYGSARGLRAFDIGIIMFVYGVARTFSFLSIPRLMKRISLQGLIRLATLLMGVSTLPIWMFETTSSYYLSFILAGAFGGMLYASTLLAMVKDAPAAVRGRYTGALESALGFGFVVGPFISGAAAEIHLTAPYLTCAAMSIIIVLIQQTIRTSHHRR